MDCWAGCTTPVGVSEQWVRSTSIQAQRYPPKQTQAHLAGLWDQGCPVFSGQCSRPHIYLGCQGDRGRGAAARSSHKRNGWKHWEAKERGESAGWDILTLPLFFTVKAVSDMFLLSSLLSGRSVEWVISRNEGLACCRPRPEPENRVAGEAACSHRGWRCMS